MPLTLLANICLDFLDYICMLCSSRCRLCMQKVGTEVGPEGKDVIDGFDFMGLGQDAEENVRKDVQVVKDCKAISDDVPVFGFIYDVQTGVLHSVK